MNAGNGRSAHARPAAEQPARSIPAPVPRPGGAVSREQQGQRVVMGQRLMQSSSDIFLGWVRGRGGRDFYVRQLRDMKMSVPIEGFAAVQLRRVLRLVAGPGPRQIRRRHHHQRLPR